MKYLIYITPLLLLLFAGCTQKEATPHELTVENNQFRIAFGSCNRQDLEQPLWDDIIAENPHFWIYLGDNIYGDTEDMAVMREKYDQAKSNPGYAELIRNAIVLGTWDDHDFGVNDGGKEYAMKRESKAEFIRFFDFPEDHEIHNHEGVYYSEDYLINDQMKLKIIMLDTRYFRDPIEKGPGDPFMVYLPNETGTLLGQAQWTWLEQELQDDFNFAIIGSSIQVIAEEHAWEKWANFPNERAKLYNLIEEYSPGKVLVISGDRHHGEISKKALPGSGTKLIDVTSSSLNRKGGLTESNKYRVGEQFGIINYGLITIDLGQNRIRSELKTEGQEVLSTYDL